MAARFRPAARAGLALALAAALAAPAAAAPSLPLDRAGTFIADQQGRVVLMHGTNMVFKRPPYAPDATGFGDDDARFLAEQGFTTVRVGLIYAAVEPRPGVYDDAYLTRIAGTVDTLARYGIVSLLDFHQDLFNERFQGEGFPDWAVQDDNLPAEPKQGFPNNYLVMPALQRAFDHFWANDPGPGGIGLQDRFAGAWAHVARRFAGHPYVMGYDLLNEPWPGSEWQPCAQPTGCPQFDAKLQAFSERVLRAIRAVDPTTMVFVEPHVIFNFGSPTTMGRIADDHLGFSFHDYCLSAGGSDSNDGCDPFDDMVFANARAYAVRGQAAPLLTEFGATGARDILTAMVERADANLVGWQEWHYCACQDPTTSGPGAKQAIVVDPAKPPTGDNLRPGTLDVLVRPYPRLVAGTPERLAYDAASGVMTTRWSTRRADGRGAFGPTAVSELIAPERAYPKGFAVRVAGGTIRSRPGERLIRVSACPGASSVSVTIAPAGPGGSSCVAPAAARARATLRVSVTPRHLRVGASRRLVVRVRRVAARGARAVPERRALVRIAGRRVRTGPGGRARLRVRVRRAATITLRVTAPVAVPAVVRLRVTR